MDGEQMHNQLGTLYQAAIHAPFEAAGKRTWSQVRSSGALASPYPFVLYSDLYNHKVFIRGVVNAGFSGLLWTPEVRQAESPEELIRRIQTTIFSPLALLNCWRIPNPPWMQMDRDKNVRGEFLDNYTEVRDACRKLFETRMSLIPYLYASFASYYFDGIPPFRALVMDYPDDPATYEIDDAYMMGDRMLVAPLITGQTERTVYLPQGGWYDFWTNERFAGGRTYTLEPGLDRVPVFVKDNTLLPLAEPMEYVTDGAVFAITVRAYGSKPQDFLLHEDDGTTFAFRYGAYNRVRLSWKPGVEGAGSVSRGGGYEGMQYRIINWEHIV
jgi:alpha-D-xyloside xylohydrolase